ncbi:CPBP family glutamic-type intramembrane protease [Dyella acidiphila]|uniref:CPBP family intramembrane metalloprotease n=1 Tax=Dyella acidiphila TaxID=2775866 RepID=A0ABR9GFM3_9GAMM|nr:CPBP family intramembrane glutamic endopeptidase [Dyella acidiphila]MBE1162832.1 CPBP family intramembrane metalloprotease [Dyella acidiphila]
MASPQRLRNLGIFSGYALAAVVLCLALSWLAARITARHLLDAANQRLALVEAGQPLWQWHLRQAHDVIAARAFGNATLAHDDDALSVTSDDGTPFELGLPVDDALDLVHWPILQLRMQSDAQGTLGLAWGAGLTPACQANVAATLAPAVRSLRIDLRGVRWQAVGAQGCPSPQSVRMLRLRIQLPAHASLRLSSLALLTTEPVTHAQGAVVALSDNELASAITRAGDQAMPWFQLPGGLSAEALLSLRDQLLGRWPGALILPPGARPQAVQPAAHAVLAWAVCALYLVALLWLALKPVHGPLRPWLEIGGCLLGPLWLVAGLHWGLRPTALGVVAFASGLLFALYIERRHLPRLWRWPGYGRNWLWPLATVPVALLLILADGHGLHRLPLAHVLAYFAWAWLQQWLMLVVLLRRLEQIAQHRAAPSIIAIALIFALLHTPNGMLMQLCFVAELWWAWCFLRARSVLPIAVAHAACALLVESGLVGSLVRSLEVSARFFL